MPHGTPDWWGVEPTSTVHQMQDAGELAVRLGSPDTYDRRGNVMFLENFEHGLGGWQTNSSGAGGRVSLSPQRALEGAYSAKFVAGSDVLRDAVIGRYLGYPVYARHGLEAAVAWGANVEYVRLDVQYWDGVTGYRSAIRYDPVNDDFEYMDAAGAWPDIDADRPLPDSDYVFHHLKFVTDVSKGEYCRALLDDAEYSLAGIPIYSTPSVTDPIMFVAIYIFSTPGNNAVGYVDSVIVTQNEP